MDFCSPFFPNFILCLWCNVHIGWGCLLLLAFSAHVLFRTLFTCFEIEWCMNQIEFVPRKIYLQITQMKQRTYSHEPMHIHTHTQTRAQIHNHIHSLRYTTQNIQLNLLNVIDPFPISHRYFNGFGWFIQIY